MKMMDDVVNNYFPELEKENMSSLNNKWGLYNVRIVHNKNVASKYQWVYTYLDGDKVKHFHSYDLRLLHKKVLEHGFDWVVLDNALAINAYKFNNELIEKRNEYIRSCNYPIKSQGYSGVNFVYLNPNDKKWVYNSNGIKITEDSLLELKKKVLSEGGYWIIKDKQIYKKNLDKE